MPGTSAFLTWLQGIDDHDGHDHLCNATDLTVLKSLYELAGGADWIASDGWLGDATLGDWHGIEADSLGRVVTLDLTGNGLSGTLPFKLGELAWMTGLRIGENALSGRLPSSLPRVPLRELDYVNTGLCAPADEAFQSWLSAIPSHEGTGVECAPLPDREILEVLYEATGGAEWDNRDNWLTDAPLQDWHGVRANDEGRVWSLYLGSNGLSGSIPPELRMIL